MGSYRIETNTSCVSEVKVRLKGDIIKEVNFLGGCQCMYQTINKLTENRNIDEVLSLLNEIELNCVNDETCISKLIKVLEIGKKEETVKEKEKNEYRVSPEGFYRSLSLLVNKPNIDFNKKYILVKINPDVYEKMSDTVEKMPTYIMNLIAEKTIEFDTEIEDLENQKLNLTGEKELNEISILINEKQTEKEEAIKFINNISDRISELKLEENDTFDGDYIFNTVWK